MCKEQEVRVKREYLVGICCDQGYGNTFRELNESCKDSFTLDEFLEFRKCVYSNEGCNWYEVDSIVTKHLFVEALELQRKADETALPADKPSEDNIVEEPSNLKLRSRYPDQPGTVRPEPIFPEVDTKFSEISKAIQSNMIESAKSLITTLENANDIYALGSVKDSIQDLNKYVKLIGNICK